MIRDCPERKYKMTQPESQDSLTIKAEEVTKEEVTKTEATTGLEEIATIPTGGNPGTMTTEEEATEEMTEIAGEMRGGTGAAAEVETDAEEALQVEVNDSPAYQ
jgi:hypothetical protein